MGSSDLVPVSEFEEVCDTARAIAPPGPGTQAGFLQLLTRARSIVRRRRNWEQRREG